MEVYRNFDARSPDADIRIPDELNHEEELQHLKAAKNSLRGNARWGIFAEWGALYCLAPEKGVEYVPFSMTDLFDGVWNEIAANDEQRRPDATFRFIIVPFIPFD